MTIEAGPAELFTTPARAADVPALVALVNSAYRGGPGRGGWTHEAELVAGPRIAAAELEAALADPDQRLIVLRGAAGPYGCARVRRLGAERAGIDLVAVRPALQGGGVGRQLLAAAERCAEDAFAAHAVEVAEIGAREELVAWLERRGYAATGETRPLPPRERFGAPQHPGLALAVMRRTLPR